MDFKTRLKELRESKGLTQKEMADELSKLYPSIKIYTQTISYWENGREPSFDILIKLSQFFNVPVDYLLGSTDKLDLNEINFDIFFKSFSNDNINAITSNLTKELKSAFFSMINLHLDSLDISDELFNGDPLTDSKLDYMYLITKLDDLISDFNNSLIRIGLITSYNYDKNILNEFSKTDVFELTDLITSTTAKFSSILNEIAKMRIEESFDKYYESKYIEELKKLKYPTT